MPNGVPDFPLPIKMVFQDDGSAGHAFQAAVDRMVGAAQQQFERGFKEISGTIDRSLTGFNRGALKFDLDVSALRQASTEATFTTQRLTAMREAATRLAASTGDTSSATTKYIQALQTQVKEAQQAERIADTQVTTYTRLQAEIDKTIGKNEALARSYRETFAEQARAANAAHQSQQAVNAGYAPGLNRPVKSAADSAAVFESQSYAPAVNAKSGLAAIMAGQGALDRAAVSAVTLESVLGRVAVRSQVVGQAMEEAGQRAERAAMEQAAADRMAAQAKSEFAREVESVKRAIDPTLIAQQRLDAELDRAERVFQAGAISAKEYGLAVNASADRYAEFVTGAKQGTTANHMLANSSRAVRVAMLQSGQQLQDVAISLYSGQKASVVFAQQLPQLAFAFTGLEGNANKTLDKLGKFGTFLAGPWGLAVGLAIGVVASYIPKLLGIGSAADAAAKAHETLTDKLDRTKHSYDEVNSALAEYNQQQRQANALTVDAGIAAANAAKANIDEAISLRTKLDAQLASINASGAFGLDSALAQSVARGDVSSRIAENQKELRDLTDQARNAVLDLGQAVGKLDSDPVARMKEGFKKLKDAAAGSFEEVRRLQALEDKLVKSMREDARQKGGKYETADFGAPLAGNLTRTGKFGEQRPGHMHGGIDYAAPTGTPVYATQAGVVEFSQMAGAFGNLIKLLHGGGTETLYGHLSRFAVAKGQEVAKGDVIGYSGSTGRSTGPHLHYEVRVNGKPVDPTKGSFPIDPAKVAEAGAKAADILQQFGERASESIARINERFNEQPKLVDQAAQATRQLDDVIKDLSERKPAGFEAMIAQANEAKGAIEDALVRPFRDMERDAARAVVVQGLIVQGRDAEAEAVQRIWRLEEQLGPLSEERRAQVVGIAQAEHDVAEALDVAREKQSAYLEATRSVRSEVEAILSGTGKFSNFKGIFKQLQGKVLTEALFGDVFRDMDKWVKKNTGLGRATDEFTQSTEKAGDAAANLADAMNAAAARIGGEPFAANDNGAVGAGGIFSGGAAAIGTLLANLSKGVIDKAGAVSGGDSGSDEIVVIGRKLSNSALALSPQDYFNEMASRIGFKLTAALDKAFGTQFFQKFSGVLSGAMAGYASGGAPGGIIGALKSIKGLPEGLQKVLAAAGEGAATGTAVAGIGKALGLKMSTTGSQIGGAIGSAIPIPGGEIIGSIIGGLIGGALKKVKSGKATIGSVDGLLDISGTGGNTKSYIKAASGAGDNVISSVQRVAEALGGQVNAALGSVTVGIRDGKWRVNGSGSSLKTSQGAVNFGKDGQAEAIAYATANLIKDGVITGLRAGSQKLLQSGKDLDTQLQKALDFEGVFTNLKAIKDPVGAALDTLDKEFQHLKSVFEEAGASTEEYAQLEEFYGLKRADAVKQATQQISGSLKSLLDDLTTGDNGLSLRDRIANSQATYAPLKARVQAGDTSAFDEFANSGQNLLGLMRELYGSQGEYFAFFDELKSVTKDALDKTTAIADAAAARESPLTSSSTATSSSSDTAVVGAINTQTSQVVAAITAQSTATNQNLGAITALLAARNDNTFNPIDYTGTF